MTDTNEKAAVGADEEDEETEFITMRNQFHALQRQMLLDVIIEMKETPCLSCIKDLYTVGLPDDENEALLARYGITYSVLEKAPMSVIFTYTGVKFDCSEDET